MRFPGEQHSPHRERHTTNDTATDYPAMDNLLRWLAISTSMLAGTFASEFLSHRHDVPVNAVPTQVAVPDPMQMPPKVAFRPVAIDRVDELNN
jgi:hypothetical protein